jgi:hypothetical protein
MIPQLVRARMLYGSWPDNSLGQARHFLHWLSHGPIHVNRPPAGGRALQFLDKKHLSFQRFARRMIRVAHLVPGGRREHSATGAVLRAQASVCMPPMVLLKRRRLCR